MANSDQWRHLLGLVIQRSTETEIQRKTRTHTHAYRRRGMERDRATQTDSLEIKAADMLSTITVIRKSESMGFT